MSWKAGLSRYLPAMRFFACPDSASSNGVRSWYCKNYDELKHLNPNFPLLLRTEDNCMPAVTTELEWTMDHLLRFMIQTGRFRDSSGVIAQDRVEAAKAYLTTDWDKYHSARLAVPGFDPERPNMDVIAPGWEDDKELSSQLATYLEMRNAKDKQMEAFKGGPDKEYTRGVNALLMAQRVDLWCAGEKEVEMAVQHLAKLGRALNERETFFPAFIKEFHPGQADI
mmetsp:Transcript_22424/g.62563  ORF Transcript_22424/g.62563 Transcript_22424/m.62563 type:complete len:225 (-) Transcript_22424:33-707(-)|eukprot:CAMPEP_0198113600 /NCGR_PEP_ID=MMETSP1442-20131203/5226_1 /TAXON_ID= /ORGANISM="Craspedostauros australis, Strain CCMP3328" /LENGTH=224 /DNA_ID=CAMNT_0043770731 /DNA_START=148 /DNA_END=822 /DNA_ORIENTATION=+